MGRAIGWKDTNHERRRPSPPIPEPQTRRATTPTQTVRHPSRQGPPPTPRRNVRHVLAKPMSDQEALDVYARLLTISGLRDAHPTTGEIRTVERALARGWTANQLETVATLSTSAAPSNQRAYLLTIIEKRGNEAPRESSSTTAAHGPPPADRTSPEVPAPNPGFTTPEVTAAGIKAARGAIRNPAPLWAEIAVCETQLAGAANSVEREYWTRALDRARRLLALSDAST